MGAKGESSTGSLLSSNGEVSDFGGAELPAPACVALPLIEKLILAFGTSFSGPLLGVALLTRTSLEDGGLVALRFFASSSSSVLRSTGGLKGLSASSGEPAGGGNLDFGVDCGASSRPRDFSPGCTMWPPLVPSLGVQVLLAKCPRPPRLGKPPRMPPRGGPSRGGKGGLFGEAL